MKKCLWIPAILLLCFFQTNNGLTKTLLRPDQTRKNLMIARADWKRLLADFDNIWTRVVERNKNVDYVTKKQEVDINGDGKRETVIFGYAVKDSPFATMWVKIYHPNLGLIFKREISDVMPCLLADIDGAYPGKEILISVPKGWDSEDWKGWCVIYVYGWDKSIKRYKEIYAHKTLAKYPVLKVVEKNGYTEMDSYTELKQFDEFLKYWLGSTKTPVQASTISYTVYRNNRFGFVMDYPVQWKPQYSQNGDGIFCISKDGHLQMRAYASFDIFRAGPEGEFNFIKKQDWQVLSKKSIKIKRESANRATYHLVGVLYTYCSAGKRGFALLAHEKNISYVVLLEASSSSDYSRSYESVFTKIIQSYRIIDGEENS